MRLTRFFNLVIIGENLPISQVRTEDFDFGDFETVEKVRLPFALELRAGPFQVVAMPERYQVTVYDLDPSEPTVSLLKQNAASIAELAGRRSVSAIGHNLQTHIIPESFDPTEVRSSVLQGGFFAEGLGVRLLPEFETTTRFEAGDSDSCSLKFGIPDNHDRIIVELNYHFDLAKNPKTPRPANAIDRYDASMAHARELVARVTSQFDSQGSLL